MVIRTAPKQSVHSIQLLGKHHPCQFVVDHHTRQRHHSPRMLPDRLTVPVRATHGENQASGRQPLRVFDPLTKPLGGQLFTTLIDRNETVARTQTMENPLPFRCTYGLYVSSKWLRLQDLH